MTQREAAHWVSHLTGLAAFHQGALHVLQPGGRGRGKWNGERERTETEMFEREMKRFEHWTLGQFRSKTWGECVNLHIIGKFAQRNEMKLKRKTGQMRKYLKGTFSPLFPAHYLHQQKPSVLCCYSQSFRLQQKEVVSWQHQMPKIAR